MPEEIPIEVKNEGFKLNFRGTDVYGDWRDSAQKRAFSKIRQFWSLARARRFNVFGRPGT